MTLTVPKAGSVAGRAAAPRFENHSAGGDVAQLGRVMTSIGQRVEADILGRERQRLNVDMMKDLNDLRLEISQIGDPDQAATAWDTRAAELRKSYFESGDEDGTPRVSAKNSEAMGLAFDELSNRHSFSVGRQVIEGRHSQHRANLMKFEHEAVRQAEFAGPEMRSTYIGQYTDHIHNLVASGVVDAAAGQKMITDFSGSWDKAYAIGLVDTDPQSFLDMSSSGNLPGLDGELQARLRVQARSNIEQASSAADRALVAEKKKADKALADRFADIRDVVASGMQSADLDLLSTEEAKAHPDYAKTMASVSLAQEQPDLARMTPGQIDALIAGEKSRPVKKAHQTERLEELERLKSEFTRGYEQDPVAYAAQAGLYVPDLPDFDPSNPVAFARGLQARVQMAAEMEEEGYLKEGRFFSDAERDAIDELVDSDQDPKSRLALAKSVALALGSSTGMSASKISDDPTFSWSTSLLAQGAPERTAYDILAGQTKLDKNTVVAPNRNDAKVLFHEETDQIFNDLPGLTDQVLGSAIAIYAEGNPIDDSGEIDDKKFASAVQRALGGSEGVGGFDEITAIGDRHTIPLPARVDHKVLDKTLDQVRHSLKKNWDASRPKGSRWVDPNLSILEGASLTGAAPNLGDPKSERYAPDDIWDDLQLAPVWPDGQPADRYALYRVRNGHKIFVRDTDGNTFTMSLGRLIEGSAK